MMSDLATGQRRVGTAPRAFATLHIVKKLFSAICLNDLDDWRHAREGAVAFRKRSLLSLLDYIPIVLPCSSEGVV